MPLKPPRALPGVLIPVMLRERKWTAGLRRKVSDLTRSEVARSEGLEPPNLQIRSSGQAVQDRPSVSVLWVDVPGMSTPDKRRLAAWQQCWQQSNAYVDSGLLGRVLVSDRLTHVWPSHRTRREPNRISSSDRGRPDRFKLDQRS